MKDLVSIYNDSRHIWEFNFPHPVKDFMIDSGSNHLWIRTEKQDTSHDNFHPIDLSTHKTLKSTLFPPNIPPCTSFISPKRIPKSDPLFDIIVSRDLGTRHFEPIDSIDFLSDGLRKFIAFHILEEENTLLTLLEYYHDGRLLKRITLSKSDHVNTCPTFYVNNEYLFCVRNDTQVLLLKLLSYPGHLSTS